MTDEYQSIPVAEARAAVQASGELEGIEGPLYLAEADARSEWLAYFSKSLYGESGHPEFAKVIVTRKGQKPREVVIAWDEYAEQMDADPEWDALRAAKPMSIFGAEVERHAYRVVFADVLAKLDRPAPAPAVDAEPWSPKGDPVRDWHADLAAASTKDAVDALFTEARSAKALTDATLHEAFTRRLREVLASATVREIVAETVADAAERVPASRIPTAVSPAVVAAKSKPLTVQPARRPQGDRPQGQRRRGKR